MGTKADAIRAKTKAQDAKSGTTTEKIKTSRRSWFPYSDIVAICATKSGITTAQANVCLKTLFGLVKQLVIRGEVVVFPGLMSFEGRIAHATTGRNPKTGEKIDIPEHIYLGMKASPKVKQLLKKQEVTNFQGAAIETIKRHEKRRQALVSSRIMPDLDDLDFDIPEEDEL